jgi:hypothetical protein
MGDEDLADDGEEEDGFPGAPPVIDISDAVLPWLWYSDAGYYFFVCCHFGLYHGHCGSPSVVP